MSELKPCPFCGEEMKLNCSGFYEHDRIPCILTGFEITEKSIPFWNRRAEDGA